MLECFRTVYTVLVASMESCTLQSFGDSPLCSKNLKLLSSEKSDRILVYEIIKRYSLKCPVPLV